VNTSLQYEQINHKITAIQTILSGFSLHPRLRVEWPDSCRTIEEALSNLPQSIEWPGVYNILIEPRGSVKRAGLVFDRGSLIAIILLRSDIDNTWQLATNWIVPGLLFPVLDGYIYDALESLQLVVHVGWWRMYERISTGPKIFDLNETHTHCMNCSTDPEIYWKESGNINFLRHARKKCKGFEVQINPQEGYEWVIRNWAIKWKEKSHAIDLELEDRIAVARYLESLGKHYTFIIYDGSQRVAGATLFKHCSSLVAGVNYRLPAYNSYGVGSYLYENIFRWAASCGCRDVDIGGGISYKHLWAPVAGSKYEFTVSPVWVHRRQVLFSKIKRSFNHIDTNSDSSCLFKML